MSAAALLAALALLGEASNARQEGQATIAAALEAGDYARAWNELGTLTDPLEQARQRAEILFRAGDPAGALHAAREGLSRAPANLELLHRATAALLWLDEPAAAAEQADRLLAAVGRADLAAEYRDAWTAAAEELRNEAVRGEQRAAAREAALRRARGTALGMLAALAAAALMVAFRTPSPPGRPA